MQQNVNTLNISVFSTTVLFDIFNKRMVFDISGSVFKDSPAGLGVEVAFSVVDSAGVPLAVIDWATPQIPDASVTQTYTLDISSFGYNFLFQAYQIVAQARDTDGTVVSLNFPVKNICLPKGFTDQGFIDGMFILTVDCTNSLLTVKEATNFIYNKEAPLSLSTSGTLYYPRGTVADIPFTFTPFTNNVVYSGNYAINNTTIAQYDFGDGVTVQLEYVTITGNNGQGWDFSCEKHMVDVMCCIVDLQNTAKVNCGNAVGERAAQQLASISVPLALGIGLENAGMDASREAQEIKKTLNCSCGRGSIRHIQPNPVNPTIYNIIITGANGTTVTPSTSGNTKSYLVSSNVFQVGKKNTGDLAFDIFIDTSTPGNIKYLISFNYAVMANYILTAIGASPTLTTQLNALITAATNIDLTTLNGKCVIDLSSINYFLSFRLASSANTVKSILIGSTVHNAPASLLVSNVAGIESWLNGLGLGVWTVSYSSQDTSFYLNVLTIANANVPVSMTITTDTDVVVGFQKTNASLVAVLQAIIDYLCNITTLQVYLGKIISACKVDYNGNFVTDNYPSTTLLSDYLTDQATTICNIIGQIASLTGVTCSKIKAVFQDYPNTPFGVNGRFYGTLSGNECASITDQQAANAIIGAVNKYSDVKSAFCAIDCSAPATCPDISAINMAIVAGHIGIYGLTWSQTPLASQTVTVNYRISGTSTWIVATNSLLINPAGNVSSNPPYLITAVTPGNTYDVQIVNNCGGSGFIGQITVPTGSVYPGSYLVNAILYNLCASSPITLYSAAPFGTGVTMYTDIGLTTKATGYFYIALATNGIIFAIDHITAIVGATTGSSCASGTPDSYYVGNNTGTVCAQTPRTLYTNGAFVLGSTVYTDMALTTPITGFSYIVQIDAGGFPPIYLLNSSTGATSGYTGLNCGSQSATYKLGNATGTVCAQGDTTLYSSAAPATGVTLFTDPALTTPITGFTRVVFGSTIYPLNSTTGVIGAVIAPC